MKLFTRVILAMYFLGGSMCLAVDTAPAAPSVAKSYERTMEVLTKAISKGQADLIRKQLNDAGIAIFDAFEIALNSGSSYTYRDIIHSLLIGKLERYTHGELKYTDRLGTLQGNNWVRGLVGVTTTSGYNVVRDLLITTLEKPILSQNPQELEASDRAEVDEAIRILKKKKDPSYDIAQYEEAGLAILHAAGINLTTDDLEPLGETIVTQCGFLAKHGKEVTAQDIMHSLRKSLVAKHEPSAQYRQTISTLKGHDTKKDQIFRKRYLELVHTFTQKLTPPTAQKPTQGSTVENPTQADKSNKKPIAIIPAETHIDSALTPATPKPPRPTLTLDLKIINESIPATPTLDPNGLPTAPSPSTNKTRAAGVIVATLGALWTLKKLRRHERGYVRKFLHRFMSQKYRDELSRSHTEHSMELSLIDSNGHEALAAASTTLLGIILACYGHYK